MTVLIASYKPLELTSHEIPGSMWKHTPHVQGRVVAKGTMLVAKGTMSVAKGIIGKTESQTHTINFTNNHLPRTVTTCTVHVV